ncbi:MAG: cell division protein ZapE [Alphaproteobacteria bacterium]
MTTPEQYYNNLVKSGDIISDDKQLFCLKKLNKIHSKLKGYDPSGGFLKSLFGSKQPDGIYMYGSVGNGKSLLLKSFYETAPTDKKIYMHFHDFLLDLNYRLKKYNDDKTDDPLKQVAQDILNENWLFCLDECVVGDVGDAMLFGRVITHIIDGGGVMICTSNFEPDKLKPRGGDASVFKPYVEKFFNKTIPHDMDSATDYRAKKGADNYPYFLYPLTPGNRGKLQRFTDDLADGNEIEAVEVDIRGHKLSYNKRGGKVICTTYDELMISPYGVEDFNHLADNCRTLVLGGMKKISDEDTVTAKRFILLVDALYEKRARLIMSAEVSAEELYTGTKVEFEYKRTLSRLKEMQSLKYRKENE